MNIENTAHFVEQSKGGSGKSVVAYYLAQYLKTKNKYINFIDTDPSNKTFSSFKALNVQAIDVISEDTNLVNQRAFDGFMGSFFENEKPMLVDTGSGDFLAINNYMLENKISETCDEFNKELYIHVPITFGASGSDTMLCLMGLLENHKEDSAKFVIWENEYDGKSNILDYSTLTSRFPSIIGVIKLKTGGADTARIDLNEVLESRMTFDEVLVSDKISFFTKRRICTIRDNVFDQLDTLFDLVASQATKKEKGKASKSAEK